MLKRIRNKFLNILRFSLPQENIAALVSFNRPGFSGIEMILPAFALFYFFSLGDYISLKRCLMGFYFRHIKKLNTKNRFAPEFG
jgi:hypothetical protein